MKPAPALRPGRCDKPADKPSASAPARKHPQMLVDCRALGAHGVDRGVRRADRHPAGYLGDERVRIVRPGDARLYAELGNVTASPPRPFGDVSVVGRCLGQRLHRKPPIA